MINNPEQMPSASLTVREAITLYLTLRTDAGMVMKSDTYRHIKKQLGQRFCAAFGDWPLVDLRIEHLRDWVRALSDSRTNLPLCLLTRRHHVMSLKVFFKRAELEGWVSKDPTKALFLATPEQEDVNVISAKDAFTFFKANRGVRAIGRLALEAFGGLRYSSAGKIQFADIHFDRKALELTAAKHKSRKRKFRQGQPNNCWEWLKAAPADCWEMTLRQYAEEKKEMLVMSGLRPMILKNLDDREKARSLRNVWRHSFATYLLAKTKDFGPVAFLMQHSSTKITEIYEGRGDELESALYFGITPETVKMSWEDYYALILAGVPRELMSANLM